MQRPSKRFPVRMLLMAVMLGTIVAGGCGGGSDLSLAPVYGTVTYQGKPLSHGEVVFTPIEGTVGPQAVGHIQSNGAFRVQTANQSGAIVGQHRITVHCREEGTEEQRRDMNFIPKSLIPAKYSNANTSDLRHEVRSGDNEVPIELE